MQVTDAVCIDDEPDIEVSNISEHKKVEDVKEVEKLSIHSKTSPMETPMDARRSRKTLSKGLKIGLPVAASTFGLGGLCIGVAYIYNRGNNTNSNANSNANSNSDPSLEQQQTRQPPSQQPQDQQFDMWFGPLNTLYLKKPVKLPDPSATGIQCTNLAQTVPLNKVFSNSPLIKAVLARLRILMTIGFYDELGNPSHVPIISPILEAFDFSSVANYRRDLKNIRLLVDRVCQCLVEKEPTKEVLLEKRRQSIHTGLDRLVETFANPFPHGRRFSRNLRWCIHLPEVLKDTESILTIFNSKGDSAHDDETLRQHLEEKDGKWILPLGNCTDLALLDNIHTLILTKDELKFIHPKRIGDFAALIKRCYHQKYIETEIRRLGLNRIFDGFSSVLATMAERSITPAEAVVDDQKICVLESTEVYDQSKQSDWNSAVKQIAQQMDIYPAVGTVEEDLT